MGVFRLIHPHPHTRGADAVDVDIAVVSGQRLKHYFRERRLIALSLGCRIMLDRTNMPLRLNYVPQPNDVIRMVRTSAIG